MFCLVNESHILNVLRFNEVFLFCRVPLREETIWIRKYCRKGFLQPTGYRPDLFENWFENEPDLIDRILKQHENYRRHKITFDELQQFYADNNLLTPYSKYKKKSNTNLSEKEYVKSIPEPVVIEPSKILKKFKGHKLSVLSEEQESQSSEGIKTEEMSSMKSSFNKKSKSLIKFNVEYQQKFPYSANLRNSKISFRLSEDFVESFNPNDESEDDFQKNILSKLLTPQPIHRPPFQFAERRRKYATTDLKSKCEKKEEIPSRVKSSVILVPEPSRFERKKLSKFMADIIMEAAMKGIIEETEREKNRLLWAKKVRSKKRRINKDHENCIKLLEEIFRTMPEKDEYCDNQLHRTCDFRNLAEDRHNSLKYWGTRTFFLNLEKDDQF